MLSLLPALALATIPPPPTLGCVDPATPFDLTTALATMPDLVVQLEPDCTYTLTDHVVASDRTLVGLPPATGGQGAVLTYAAGAGGNLLTVQDGATLVLQDLELDGGGTEDGLRGLFVENGDAELIGVYGHGFSHDAGGFALVHDGQSLVVTGSELSDNDATWGGHVFVGFGSELSLTGSTLSGGVASTSGGGLYLKPGSVADLDDVVATDHAAVYGGLLFNEGGTLTAERLDSSGTEADQAGGALYLDANAHIDLCASEIEESASVLGGAIYTLGTLTTGVDTKKDSCFASTITSASADTGGAIASGAGASTTLHLLTIDQATSDTGGAIWANGSASLTLDTVIISDADATGFGGGVYLQGVVDLVVDDLVVRRATGSTGGCLYLDHTVPYELVDLTLEDCSAVDGPGGALWSNGPLTVTDATLVAPSSSDSGGGLYLSGAHARTFDAVTVIDPFAALDGGAVSVWSTGTALHHFTDLRVEGAIASSGGALSVFDAIVAVDRFHLEGSSAAEGSAVLVSRVGDLTLTRGLVCDSQGGLGTVATRRQGGAHPRLVMDRVGLLGNVAVRGAGLDLQDQLQTIQLDHLHLLGNEAGQGAAIYAGPDAPSVPLAQSVVAWNTSATSTSAAVDGDVSFDTVRFEDNVPQAATDSVELDEATGIAWDGSCTWEAIRSVQEVNGAFPAIGVWADLAGEETWPDGVDHSLDGADMDGDADDDGVPWLHDCDDGDALRVYGLDEVCDGRDNDCDGEVDGDDEGIADPMYTWHRDLDGDGYGDLLITEYDCAAVAGYVLDASDCDDTDPSVPFQLYADQDGDGVGGAPAEVGCDPTVPNRSTVTGDCNDGNQNVQGPRLLAMDADGDGFGSMTEPAGYFCEEGPGHVRDRTDCDDQRSDVFPGAPEVCDAVDQDCDGDVDEDAGVEVYADADGDGFGVGKPTLTCDPASGAPRGDDCDDTDPERALDCDAPGPGEVVVVAKAVEGCGCAVGQQSPWSWRWIGRR